MLSHKQLVDIAAMDIEQLRQEIKLHEAKPLVLHRHTVEIMKDLVKLGYTAKELDKADIHGSDSQNPTRKFGCIEAGGHRRYLEEKVIANNNEATYLTVKGNWRKKGMDYASALRLQLIHLIETSEI